MKNSKRKSNGKRLLSVLLAAMLIGSATVATSSYTGVGISASAVTDTAKTSASDFEYSTNDDGTVTITGYNGSDTEITIPSEIDGMTVKEIGKNAFDDCDNLKSLTIPGNVEKIGNSAFSGCPALEKITIQNGVKEIGNGAFSTGELGGKYTSVNIPASVISIGFGAFRAYKLNSINVDKDNSVYSSKDGALFNKDGTKILFYPHGKEATASVLDGVKEIGDRAFFEANCTDSTFKIPDSVEVIGEYAFARFGSFESVAVNNIKKLEIGKNVKSIGTCAFSQTFIKEVTFPENIEYIGLRAFETGIANWNKENTTFNGYTGSYADLYCKAYGYKFVSIGTVAEKPEVTDAKFGIKVKGSFPDGATLSVKEGTSKLIPDPVFFYNISLNKDGKEVQPTGFVTVSIPCDVENCVVYYEDAENNTLTDMNAIYLDGCYIFSTNHFSDYIIVPNGTQINANVIQPSFEPTSSTVTPEKPNNSNTDNNNTNDNDSNTDNNNTNDNDSNTDNNNTNDNDINTDNNNADNNNTTNNNNVPATADSGLPVLMTALLAAISGITAVIFSKRKKREQ